jgi:hypothetical protein
MPSGQQPAETERQLPWGRIGWLVLFCMIVLTMALNAIYRDVGNKAAIERVRQAEEYMTNGPKAAPAKAVESAKGAQPFSAEQAEREMAERERAVRAQVEADLTRKEDENRRRMERTNRDYERERRREAAELRARQANRIP